MLIENIIEKIDQGGPKSYYAFETLVIEILKHHLSKQKKLL